jgi:hypothetical protein
MRRAQRHVRSNLVAYLALFVALGGTSWAAVSLPRNSVGSAQLKSNAVTSAKVRDGSLQLRDFRSADRTRLRGPAGAAGAPGPAGAAGAAGAIGPAGPSSASLLNDAAPLLAGKSETGGSRKIVTKDAGDVVIVADMTLSWLCGGADGEGYRCGAQWALTIDGQPVLGTGNGLASFAVDPDAKREDRVLIGIVRDLPAGEHELRLVAGPDQAGPAVVSGPSGFIWSAAALRVGDT